MTVTVSSSAGGPEQSAVAYSLNSIDPVPPELPIRVAVSCSTVPTGPFAWFGLVDKVGEARLIPPVTVMDSACVTVAGGFSESVTETVNEEVPSADA